MKRIFPFFLAGILLLSFSACSSETSGPDQVSSTESSTVQPPETDSDATQSSFQYHGAGNGQSQLR